MVFLSLGVGFIATSALFSELIEVIVMRFSFANDLNSFTTGRIRLWDSYIKEIMGNAKVFFFGKGFTDVKVNGRASHNTIIQIFYQFGLIGAPMLLYWVVCFFREASQTGQQRRKPWLRILIIAIGSFIPWMAIDVLFADEFFLLQWYMLIALKYIKLDNDETIHTESGANGGYLWTRE